MNTRQTSIEAYRNLIDNGVLAEKNSVVYKHLFLNGATTQKKTERHFNDRTYTLRPRFAQLEAMGLIKPVGEEVCEETGKKNMVWDVTSRVVPLEVQKPTTKKQRTETALQALRDLYKSGSCIKQEWVDVADLIKAI